jgi:hypothetical protein
MEIGVSKSGFQFDKLEHRLYGFDGFLWIFLPYFQNESVKTVQNHRSQYVETLHHAYRLTGCNVSTTKNLIHSILTNEKALKRI